MPDSTAEAEVVNAPEESRYELRLHGRLIGIAAYRLRNGRIAFTHTEVDEPLDGRGFGSRLVGAALEDAAKQGLDVVPLCPFVAYYIEQHPSRGLDHFAELRRRWLDRLREHGGPVRSYRPPR